MNSNLMTKNKKKEFTDDLTTLLERTREFASKKNICESDVQQAINDTMKKRRTS